MADTDKLVYLPQLQRYDEKIKGWADGKFLLKTQADSLPKATTTALGGVMIGTGLNVATDGTASVDDAYVDGRVTAVGDKKYALADDGYSKSQTYSKTEVDNMVSAALTSAIVPKGTVVYASLPTPAKANLGYMYNVSDAFTADARFVEGAGKKYDAGANVYVVAVATGSSTEYKFDVFMGFVDLSGYQTKADMPGAATDDDIDAMFASKRRPLN